MRFRTFFICVLIFLILIPNIPNTITLIYSNVCYGCTTIGKIHQYLNIHYRLEYICWLAYLVLFTYLIYLAYQNIRSNLLKCIVIFACIFMIYLPTIPLLNLITIILSIFYQNPPFIQDYYSVFPGADPIEKHADIIIEEYKKFSSEHQPSCIRSSNPGFTIETTKDETKCWRSIYLKKGGIISKEMVDYFPNTIPYLEDDIIHNAFFSILDPTVEIPPHIGYYKGYLRYHMGVVIPETTTGEKAYIICGDKKYVWKEKEGVMFDDMYLHYVKNPTNQTRVVLYLDIKRVYENPFLNTLNNIGIALIDHSLLFSIFLKNQHSQRNITE